MNQSPLVSIIMPAFNAEKYLKESVDSILNQTYKNWELLIINDGSSDNTEKLISEYVAQDSRIFGLENEGNKGLVFTRNKGLQAAKGKYVANLDSDDIAYPNRLNLQINYLEENPNVVLLGSSCELIDEKGNHLGFEKREIGQNQIKSVLVFSNYFINSTVVIRREKLENLSYADNYAPAEDYQLVTQLKDSGELVNLEEVLVKYRLHGNNISTINKKEQDDAIRRIHKNLILELGVQFNEPELRLHSQLVVEKGRVKEAELEAIESWLLKLKNANYKANKYNVEAFDHFCAFFYRRACQKAFLGLGSFLRFRKSTLSKSEKNDFKGNGVFLLKSILKKN